MSKNKRGVFSMITGMDGVENMISNFVNTKTKTSDPRLTKELEIYNTKLSKIYKSLEELGRREEKILQLRALSDLKDISFILVRDTYIYARADFYRQDNKIKDLRVIVGKCTSESDFTKQIKSRKFIDNARLKLKEEMERIISETIQNFNKKV